MISKRFYRFGTNRLSSSPAAVRDITKLFPAGLFHLQDNNNTTIHSFAELVCALPGALARRKKHRISPGSSRDPVYDLLSRTSLSKAEWKKFAFFDQTKPYTRNLIASDHKNYTLLLLCWNPNRESPIHDHPCDGCWLKVLQGSVQECRYDSNLNCTSDQICKPGKITYITDLMGYHKVGNPTLTPSVSLHLYSPPFSSCRVWRDSNEPTFAEDCSFTNHSEFGELTLKRT